MYSKGVEIPRVSFSALDYTEIEPGSYFIGFNLDVNGKLCKIDSTGTVKVIEGSLDTGVISLSDDGGGVVEVYNGNPLTPIIKFNGINTDGVTIGGDGTLLDPISMIGTYQEVLVSGTNIKTVNGISLLGSGNVSTYLNNGNILYVATTGSDADSTRAGHIGSPNLPFLTIDAAVAAATSGDMIYVFSGEYTVASNIAKNGVRLYFEEDTTVTMTAAGTMFDLTGITSGFEVLGYANFVKSTNTGSVVYFNSASGQTIKFQAKSVTSSVASPVFYVQSGGVSHILHIDTVTSSASSIIFINYGTGGGAFDIKGFAWRSTAASVITGQWWYYTGLTINVYSFESTTSATIATYNIGALFNLNIAYFKGAQYALTSGDGHSKNINVVSSYCSGINDGGESNKYRVTGYCETYNGSVFIHMDSCSYVTVGGGYCKTMCEYTPGITYPSVYQTGGTLDVVFGRSVYGTIFTCSGGTMNIYGAAPYGQTSINADRTINGGTVNIYSKFTYGYGLDPSYFGFTGINLSSGTLRLCNAIHNVGNSNRAFGIEWSGGNLILEDATIVTSNQYAHAIRSTSPNQVIKLTGKFSSNRIEDDAVLGGKYHEWQWSVGPIAVSQAVINGITVSESDTVTYNTQAKIAQRMAELINAHPVLSTTLIAFQDNPGSDTTFKVRHQQKGPTFTASNGLNLSYSIVRFGSYPMTTIGSGLMICDSNITC